MRKFLTFLLLAACVLALVGCGGAADGGASIDYGDSALYSKADLDAAIAAIEAEFQTWEGCELHSLRYGSDEMCSAENLDWMNALEAANDNAEVFSQCLMFYSDFHSPKSGGGAWEADAEYRDWQWWLARSEGGAWKLMTWGY